MTSNSRSSRAAKLAGLAGGTLGVIAGVVQAAAGTHIPEWGGNKNSPLQLGLLTVVLSALSLLPALNLRRSGRLTAQNRTASAAAMLVPGLVCFSTVGRLWYLPGSLLLIATAFTVADDFSGIRGFLAANWSRVLLSILGAFEILIALSAGSLWIVAIGVVAGIALIAAPWMSTVGLRMGLLLVGTLPFAVIAWWSLVPVLVSVVALALGISAFRPRRRHAQGI